MSQASGVQAALPFLRSWLSYRARQQDLNFSITIRDRSKIYFTEAYGVADGIGTQLTVEHMFHVASQTKILTAAAIMLLAEQDKLKLDDAVGTYLPWVKKHKDSRFQTITIRHLLTHTSGLMRDLPESDYLLFEQPWPTYQTVERMILAEDLIASPGSHVKYSNTGFALLGQLIAAVSAMPYRLFIQKNILDPLRLEHVAIDYSASLAKYIPTGYGLRRSEKRAPIHNRRSTQGMTSAMGAYATPSAMCHLIVSLLRGGDILSRSSRELMQQTQSTISEGYDQGISFGFGLQVQKAGQRRLVGHSGHMGGHVTATFYDPQSGLAVSAAGISKDTPSVAIVHGIFGAIDHFIIAGKTEGPDKRRLPFNARLSNKISTVEIVHAQKKIVAIDPDDWAPFAWSEELEIIDETTLRATDVHSLYNSGERIYYEFRGESIQRVRFAGLTMWPEIL